MMKRCPKCENLYPDYYKKCVSCGETNLSRMKYTPIDEVEIVEISPFVEVGELNEGEME